MSEKTSLYARLGGAPGVTAIANDIVERHKRNDLINTRFLASDTAKLKQLTAQFISMGTGGPSQYEGRDLVTTHKGMNLNERELVAAIDDILEVLVEHKIDSAARGEVLTILYSLKHEVLYL